MSFDPHANGAYSVVAVAPSPATSGVSLSLSAGDGSLFPDPATFGAYNISVWPNTAAAFTKNNGEIVRVTARSGDVLTITRNQESGSARSIVNGDQVAMAPTAKTFTDIEGSLRSIFIGANQFEAMAGLTAPSGGLVHRSTNPSQYDAWVFDHNGGSPIGLAAKDMVWIPGNWPNVKLSVLWSPVSGSGGIVWSCGVYSVKVDNSQFPYNTTNGAVGVVTDTIAGGGILKTVIASGGSNSFNNVLGRAFAARNTASGSDGTGVVDFIGLLLEAAP